MSFELLKSKRITLTESAEDIAELLYQNGFCVDGLPVVPPTEERVSRVIEYNKLDPQQIIAKEFEPSKGVATVEKIAINAVMAGCLPEYLPVLIAAVEAMTAEGFDLFGVQATTHPCGMVAIINGPIRDKLNVNCGSGAMGPGWRANATIGRAVRLMMLNLGGATPGEVDKSTQGTPAKYTFCFGENEAESPWEPFHVSRGFDHTDSTVTVLGLEGPHDVNGQDSKRAGDYLKILSGSIISPGSSNFRFIRGADMVIALCPEHAAILGRDGVTRSEVQEYLFEHARVPLQWVHDEHIAARKRTPVQYGEFVDGQPIPVALEKENFLLLVVGGAGLHTSWMPSWGGPQHRAVTKKIRVPE
jgi:hypothetical protein